MILPRNYQLTNAIKQAAGAKPLPKPVIAKYSAIMGYHVPPATKPGLGPKKRLKSRITLPKVWDK